MSKREQTQLVLEAALERILNGQTTRVPSSRKLSARAVEEEAGLGNGSCYYYPDIVEKIKKSRHHQKSLQDLSLTANTLSSQQKFHKERQIKVKYKQENLQLKTLISQMATEHHHLNEALRKALATISELEKENFALREKYSSSEYNTLHIISDSNHN